MCGRFTLHRPGREVAEAFGLAEAPLWEPRFNIAPTQSIFSIRNRPTGERECVLLRWGLIAPWGDTQPPGPPLINAKAETVAKLPSFRDAFLRRRCLVAADGFFEWTTEGSSKRPHYFTQRDGRIFAIAALWEPGREQDQPGSVAILTTEANELVRPIHERMPVILPSEAERVWLAGSEVPLKRLRPLLRPISAEEMEVRQVGSAVGNVRNEGPQCIEALGPAPQQRWLF